MDEPAIRIESLCKTYAAKGVPAKRALNDVTFDVPRGQIFGLLGPNGAGKSTLINILAGLVVKSSGSVDIWGFDIDEHPRNAKRSIGIVPLSSGDGVSGSSWSQTKRKSITPESIVAWTPSTFQRGSIVRRRRTHPSDRMVPTTEP